MEKWQKEAIDQTTDELYEQTTFSPTFLDGLFTKRLITQIEIDEFERIQNHTSYGRYKSNKYIFNLLKTRENAFNILIKLLEDHNQPELAKLLVHGRSTKLENSPDLVKDSEPACQAAGTSASFKRPYTFHTADSSQSKKFRRHLFDLQDPSPFFVGREEELEQVHQLLGQSRRFAVITHITSVSGLGGVGKTQLARKYAQLYKGHYDNNVLWINAESEESMTSSFYKLGSNKLQISTKNADDKEKEISVVVQDCYDYFQNMKCLYIFDNVEKEEYLKTFLPHKDASDKIYVLMTSRQQNWGRTAQVIGLNVFSEEEAIRFVKNGLEIEGGSFDEDIKLLVIRLQYFPLAISQAISYIFNEQEKCEFSIKDYLDELENSPSHLLDCDISDEFETSYSKTTFTTWKMTIDKISQTPECGHLAVKIMNLVAYFSPDDIHRVSFFKLDEYPVNMVIEAINLLVKYSMVSAKDRQSIFSVHRLVQEVCRIDILRAGKESVELTSALELAEKCLSLRFRVHAVSVLKYADNIPKLISKCETLRSSISLLLFVGREKELAELHRLLNGTNRLVVITQITSVGGMGGIGKTLLARKYAQVYKSHYHDVIRVNAESEQALISSFTKLAADKYNISTKAANDTEKDIQTIVQECYGYFHSKKCLFILDNVEKGNYLNRFLPLGDTSNNVFVLMTSRHQDWGKHAGKLVINVFSEEEAIAFVRNGLEVVGSLFEDDIKLLVCRLHYFPIAITQAISYISNQQKIEEYSVQKYLDDLDLNTSYHYDMSDKYEGDYYDETIFTTLKMAINKIAGTPECGQLALKIINLVAYFSPDDIPRNAFDKLDECTDNMMKQAVSLLVQFSILTDKDNQNIFSIHRLVQGVVRNNLQMTGREEEAIDIALQCVEKCISENFVSHAISIWEHAEKMPQLVCKFVNLATKIMNTLRGVGRYSEACIFGEKSLHNLKYSNVENQLSFLEFQRSLGVAFRFAGEFGRSLYHLESVQEECKPLDNTDAFLLQVQEDMACLLGHLRPIKGDILKH